jgi:hypothetical protein
MEMLCATACPFRLSNRELSLEAGQYSVHAVKFSGPRGHSAHMKTTLTYSDSQAYVAEKIMRWRTRKRYAAFLLGALDILPSNAADIARSAAIAWEGGVRDPKRRGRASNEATPH